jgi:hypothetical protein
MRPLDAVTLVAAGALKAPHPSNAASTQMSAAAKA